MPKQTPEQSAAALDDETLVFTMFGLLMHSGEETGGPSPLFGGQTEVGGDLTRAVFAEIARRWIPPDVCLPAFDEIVA
jgi:hypothetical protein